MKAAVVARERVFIGSMSMDPRSQAMEQARTRQPARNFWQRVEDMIFMAFPRDLY